jgi:hypothetical protein
MGTDGITILLFSADMEARSQTVTIFTHRSPRREFGNGGDFWKQVAEAYAFWKFQIILEPLVFLGLHEFLSHGLPVADGNIRQAFRSPGNNYISLARLNQVYARCYRQIGGDACHGYGKGRNAYGKTRAECGLASDVGSRKVGDNASHDQAIDSLRLNLRSFNKGRDGEPSEVVGHKVSVACPRPKEWDAATVNEDGLLAVVCRGIHFFLSMILSE